jgi:pyrophosphatase PpaX
MGATRRRVKWGLAPRNAELKGAPVLPYPAVLFDLDGTLLDSVALTLGSLRHTLLEHGLPIRADAEILAGIGTPLCEQLEGWATPDAPLPRLIATYRTHHRTHHDAMARPYPGVCDVVAELAALGGRLGLVTNKGRAGAERGLAILELAQCFEVIASDTGLGEPPRSLVDHAVAMLGGDRHQTLFIGDSVHDIEAGRAAGVRTAAVLWGPFPVSALERAEPDFLVADAAELRALVGVG